MNAARARLGRAATGGGNLRRWIAAVALGAIVGWSPLRADVVLSVPMASGSDASIKVSTPCPEPPRFGFMPVRVTVENAGPTERTWQFQFQSGVRGRTPGIVAFNRSVTVPAGQTREAWVYVPVAEPGEEVGAPTLGQAGIRPAPVSIPRSAINVKITKTAVGTKVTRTMPIGGRGVSMDETEINETTGEMTRSTTSMSGITNVQKTIPPPGSDVTYTIDPFTGLVNTRFGPTRSAPGGATTVKVVQATGTRSSMGPTGVPGTVTSSGLVSRTPPMGATPTVLVTPTPDGTKVTRITPQGGGQSSIEEREIDAKTGVITTTRTLASGRRLPAITTPPVDPGFIATFTIDSASGLISQQRVAAASPTSPPQIKIVTGGPAFSSTTVVRGTTLSVSGSGATTTRFVPTFSNSPMTISVDVTGPGIVASNRLQFPTLSADGGMRPMAAAPAIERVLSEGLKAEGIRTPNVATIELAQLPPDWRIWSPYATVLLPVDEFAAADVAHRSALRAWVASGGCLVLVPGEAGERAVEKCGAGEIVTLGKPMTSAPLSAELLELGISIGSNVGHPDRSGFIVSTTNALGLAAQQGAAATVWIGFFLVAFAAVVGPVNLFVFAPVAKRHRLFFTTPIISLAVVVLLVITIVAQDGIGGVGWRHAVVVFVPKENQAVVVQEQAAHTGFLARQSFALSDDTQLAVLPFSDENGFGFNFSAGADYVRSDGQASGGWFRSRSRVAQLLQRVVPTRGRVERVGTAPDGAPIVESSIGVALKNFACVDEQGATWGAGVVQPGHRVTLTRGGTWVASSPSEGTTRFADLLTAAAPQKPGHWGATAAAENELAPVATLPAIHWKTADTFMTGVLEGNAPKAEAAR